MTEPPSFSLLPIPANWRAVKDDGPVSYHILHADDDIEEHVYEPGCWCQPTRIGRDLFSCNELWLHRRAKDSPC